MRREGTEPTLFAPGTEGSNLAPSTSESCANLTSSPSRWGPATGSPLCEASRRDLNREWPEGHPVAKHVAVRWMTTGGLAFTFNDLSRRKPPVVPRQDRGRPAERPAGRGSPVIADCGKLVPRSRLRQARGGWMRRAVVNQGPLSNHGHYTQGYCLRSGLLSAPARILQSAAPFLFGLLLDRVGIGAIGLSAGLCFAAFGSLFLLRPRHAPGLHLHRSVANRQP